MGGLYVVVVQAVLLFGSETWLMIPRLEKAIDGFYQRAVWRMAGMGPKRQQGGTWVYTPIGAALAMVGLEDIGLYIARRQNTVAQYIATRPIMYICLVVELHPGMRLSRRWWEKPALDILEIRAWHALAEGGGGG